jgi:hypothetical protein
VANLPGLPHHQLLNTLSLLVEVEAVFFLAEAAVLVVIVHQHLFQLHQELGIQ